MISFSITVIERDATELSLVVIALSGPSGVGVAQILDTSTLNRTNCDHQKVVISASLIIFFDSPNNQKRSY